MPLSPDKMELKSRFKRPTSSRVSFGPAWGGTGSYWLTTHQLMKYEVHPDWVDGIQWALSWQTGAKGDVFAVQDIPLDRPVGGDKVRLDLVAFLASKGLLAPVGY